MPRSCPYSPGTSGSHGVDSIRCNSRLVSSVSLTDVSLRPIHWHLPGSRCVDGLAKAIPVGCILKAWITVNTLRVSTVDAFGLAACSRGRGLVPPVSEKPTQDT